MWPFNKEREPFNIAISWRKAHEIVDSTGNQSSVDLAEIPDEGYGMAPIIYRNNGLVFVSHSFLEESILDTETAASLGNNPLLLEDFDNSVVRPAELAYNVTSMAALAKLRFDGGVVADLGCGNGMLSLAALRNGAAHVIGVDIDRRAIGSSKTI